MTSNQRILNVDDNEAGRYATSRILARAGYEVLEAANGADALKLAAQRPDLILLDVSLPDMSGFEVCRRIKADPNLASILVVHLSAAYVRGDNEVQGLDGGADGYLAHPIDATELVATVRAFLRLSASEAALRESEAQFRGLVEQSIAGIYIIQDDKFVYVNPRFAEIRGYASSDEIVGRDALSLVAAEDRGSVAENNRRLLAGEARSIPYSFGALHKDGSTIEVGAHAARASYKGRPAVIGLVQDITEKKRAEEQVQHHIAQLEIAFMSTVGLATTLAEMRDPYRAGHERRVGELAAAIGAELGFDAQRIQGLRVAGSLHDIGTISIPAEILAKPGKLSPVEIKLIQGHSQAGYEALKDVKFPWPVAEVALQHHERMDGSGYPQGLKGEAILFDARILAVADVVEAMASHRPHRAALGIEAALAEIARGRASAYDPMVADACLKLFRERGYALPA